MTTLLLSIFLAAPFPSHIVYLQENVHSVKTEALFAAENVLTGCVVAGLGAIYNDGSFLTGCVKGSIGGSFSFLAKYEASYLGDYPGLGALAHITANVGNSITQAGFENRAFDSVYVDFGPIGITFAKKIDWSFTLFPVGGIVGFVARGDKFDFKNTLYNFTPTFVSHNKTQLFSGDTMANVVEYNTHYMSMKSVLAHEQIHTLQWAQFQVASKFFYHYNYGQDAAFAVAELDGLLNYYDIPEEMEAYGMVRVK